MVISNCNLLKSLLHVRLSEQLPLIQYTFDFNIFNKIMFTVANPHGIKWKLKVYLFYLRPHKYNPRHKANSISLLFLVISNRNGNIT